MVGSPEYFERHPKPITPYDLAQHPCINMRPRPMGSIYAWEFESEGKPFTMKVEGPLVFNSIIHVLNSALDGIGLGYVPEQLAEPYIRDGRLIEVLPKWCPYFEGFHLYYPNRRHASPAFSALVEALRK